MLRARYERYVTDLMTKKTTHANMCNLAYVTNLVYNPVMCTIIHMHNQVIIAVTIHYNSSLSFILSVNTNCHMQ